MKRVHPPKRKGRKLPQEQKTAQTSALDQGGRFPVVGIGASAGGLEAFSNLLAQLPDDTGMAFVFVQHLDPTHSSALEEILSRVTRIPVSEVRDGVVIEPDHVYIIPPNSDMVVQNGALRLSSRTLMRGQHRPVDGFFRSLAEDRGDQAIGVILSGTAADGTAGCASIKAAGGITFAQDDSTAKHSGMPNSAVESGCIDFVLPPKAIAQELARIGKHPYVARALPENVTESRDEIHTLFSMIRQAKGVDFTHYKQTTLRRRIKRRMVVNRIEKLEDYMHFVEKSPKELEELYRDILINVTGFFRDPGVFEALRAEVFPNLVRDRKTAGSPIRIWVPGCSTGEEAYSLAMALLEYFWDNGARESSNVPPIQIFGTDVSDEALDRARAGIYSEASMPKVSPARLKRFFVRADGRYQVNKSIRDLCIFAKQNVAKDPPFSNLDLISCRNLLIYLGLELQKRVIPALHYGLKPNGYLVVGSAESLSAFSDHFNLIDKKYRIYQKKKSPTRLITYFSGADYSPRSVQPALARKEVAAGPSIDKEVDRVLVNRFVPASIVINSEMEIVQFRGKTGAYLEPATGQPTFNLSKMAREGLLVDLRAALDKAKKEDVTVRKEGVSIQSNGGGRQVDLEVIPVRGESSHERFYIVIFQEPSTRPSTAEPPKRVRKARGKETSTARENERLKHEIRQLRDQMQALIEEHEMTSEEFKTANEEVLSANEELQSTNEELETTKEELQSTNEELTTLNEEVQNRNAELSLSNSDLNNLFSNANIPVVMVSDALRIRRFTPPAEKLLNLLPGDLGRRLGEIRPNINVDNLEQIVQRAIENASLQETEVRDSSGSWYSMRARPYRTLDNRIDGAVISFQDINKLKHTLEETKMYADTVIGTTRESIVVLDRDLRVLAANQSFYNTFRVSKSDTENQHIYDLGNRQWDIPRLRELLGQITQNNAHVDEFEVRHDFPSLGERIMVLNARRLEGQSGRPMIILSIEDTTEKNKQVALLIRQAALLELVHDAVIMRNVEGNILYWNHGAEEMYGYGQQEALKKTTHELLRTQFPIPFKEIQKELRRVGHWEGELVHTRSDGSQISVSSRWAMLGQGDGPPAILEINTDISDRKEAQENLRQLSGHLMRVQDEERRRMARELHDSTGQKLAAAKLQVDVLARKPEFKTQEKTLLESAELIDEAFQEIRTFSQLLHPPLLDEAGLVSATRWMVDGFSTRAKIPVEFEVSGKMERLSQPVELALFRVIQECLNNIRRHSNAKQARIELAQTGENITLRVQDDGKGMPPELLSASDGKQVMGVGILGMKERLSQLGGTLEIESSKKGTTVKAVVPAQKAATSSA